MNKKTIKYLIWIILIAATLMLILGKETMASTTVSYSTFKESENLYCLNKGNRFSSEEEFDVTDISGDFEGIDRDVLEYIITEASTTYNGRSSIGNYTPQNAIWKLVGSSVSSNEADKLIARANAYNKYIDNKKYPIIEKEGSDKVAIYYYEYEGDYNNVKDTYTNLKSITINGNAFYSNPASCDYKGYNRKITYTKAQNETKAEVIVTYENYRDATLKKYSAHYNSTLVVTLGTGTSNNVIEYFKIIGTKYYHENCEYSLDECTPRLEMAGWYVYTCKCGYRTKLSDSNGSADILDY